PEYVLDATKYGNLSRFINHSSDNPNCHARIFLVNSEHRIGIFASQNIEHGEELFFNYMYKEKHGMKFVHVERGPTFHIPPKRSVVFRSNTPMVSKFLPSDNKQS